MFYLAQRGQTPRRRQTQGNADLAKVQRNPMTSESSSKVTNIVNI
ncbi:hypothetical protein Xen7305DRAFT_00040870 [Xenococcus sp. PCC 7305]|nr:hypothetical protein Xen7305DRAFT_00040870 [Xenococcus sp. PCC 7305]